MFILRFDMRIHPDHEDQRTGLYEAALEMSEWGERNSCLAIVVSEHHASPDGYLPSPLVLAAAVAARTRTVPIQVAALLLPLHDPIDLAEQMAVLDLTSKGRVSYVCGVGYRPEEYAMFGREMAERGRRMEACLAALKQSWTGEPFDFEGRRVRVTPRPSTPGGPTLLMGGGSRVAVRRAARFGMGVLTQGGDASLERVYEAECEKQGTAPGVFIHPPSDTVTCAFVAEDPDAAWQEIGPYLMHDARMYAAWMGNRPGGANLSMATSEDELRAQGNPYRIFTPEEARQHIRTTGIFLAQPLCGGLPPDVAWKSLELLRTKVLPTVSSEASSH